MFYILNNRFVNTITRLTCDKLLKSIFKDSSVMLHIQPEAVVVD